MALDYPEEPEEDNRPDEVVVHRWEVAQSIIKKLGLQESESNLHAISHGLMGIQEAYEEARFYYVDEHFADASKEIKKVAKAAKNLRLSLAQLGDGARLALNSNTKTPERKQAWEKAGGDNLPQIIGPAPEESRFDIRKDHEGIWKEGEHESQFGIFGPSGYRPSPFELQLKRLEELIEVKVNTLRKIGKSRKPKRMGDVLDGSSPRHNMIGMCTILLGTHGQDLSTKLLPLMRLIEENVVGPVDEVEWKGDEAAMRARWWWQEVGPYYGKPAEEVPLDKVDRLKKGWTSMPRYKQN